MSEAIFASIIGGIVVNMLCEGVKALMRKLR